MGLGRKGQERTPSFYFLIILGLTKELGVEDKQQEIWHGQDAHRARAR